VHPWMIAAPVLGIAGPLLALALIRSGKAGLAFVASGIGILGVVATAGVSMFPFLMPSSLMPGASLTVWDASSSQLTLFVMLICTLIFLPIVLIYTAFVYRVMRGAVTGKQIESNAGNFY
jgi:cytochrome bd ubiquinol oxidase subunit II